MTDPIRDLESLSSLLFDPDARSAAAEQFTPQKWGVVEQIIQQADRLQSITGWEDEELLRRLGCRVRTFDDFNTFELDRLENCKAFLSLVNELAELVGPLFQQREVVSVCVDLLEDRSALSAHDLRTLLTSEVDGWSPYKYVGLGEVSRAARLVRSLANARRTPEPTAEPTAHPFASATAVHLSTPRIDLYVRRDIEALGSDVCDRITSHLAECDACRAAVEDRAARLADLS